MPKLTDIDGPACTELGIGRDWHYADHSCKSRWL